MLQIRNISKQYKTGSLVQKALDDVSLDLRDSEFVAVLGPSGSGKTTLLNIIGGLDRYDSGDLIINSVSTKDYKNKDWDSYRNHSIGFVFQSYNLIQHQSVLANVELALTIGGVSRSERKKRAKKALEDVGLGEHMHKRPNQLSGGQMQRVAIARALVNDPDILLADEPTGALDSQTSIQVMELLKEVAKDRLVVMVTHNPELAQEYATRIIRLKDGCVTDDSDPFSPQKAEKDKVAKQGKAGMSFRTSLALSFNNLRTKKGRTILTSFAGSIGIIGIALILALSTGVNTYIYEKQKETMLSYPITITSRAVDINALNNSRKKADENREKHSGAVYASYNRLERRHTRRSSVMDNDLTSFKKYLDDPQSDIRKYLGENGVIYTYDLSFEVFSYDSKNRLVNSSADPDKIGDKRSSGGNNSSNPTSVLSSLNGTTGSGAKNFTEIMKGTGSQVVSSAIKNNYDLVYGEWCSEYNEVVLALDENSSVSAEALYQLGIITAEEYTEIADKISSGENAGEKMFSYEQVCQRTFYIVPACDRYVKGADGRFTTVSELDEQRLIKSAIPVKISGIVREKEDITVDIDSVIGYNSALTNYIIEHTDASQVVMAQEASKDINVLTGMKFDAADDNAKVADARKYIASLGVGDKASLYTMAMYYSGIDVSDQTDENEMAKLLDRMVASEESRTLLIQVYDRFIAGTSYKDNMESFGKVSLDSPSSINIYCDSFEDKDKINQCIQDYNDSVESDKAITYTDYVALITESITSIVNAITYVLVAFVAVSLVVSSIMIGIITHISVLERTKEIGILRALGASKRNISRVFNAETFIIGFCSGALGVILSEILLFPINSIIKRLAQGVDVTARLPILYSVVLILISMAITMIGGFIPAKRAAKKDPVIALRTE
ncbi:ABC transporter ATP-binding protein/permease [Ruminococcus sp. FC2018]|uniref:ABC transporter ATP-binding protein/permease n=1 Tax=Ruminococcus sp. FC2018 TaxID=1410617 RepID=UPI00048CE07A|nr:ABC transporter ATP-binding protein/permease [Ruminococcus sp. FC2018]